jgi:hypothetical protein
MSERTARLAHWLPTPRPPQPSGNRPAPKLRDTLGPTPCGRLYADAGWDQQLGDSETCRSVSLRQGGLGRPIAELDVPAEISA